MSDQPRQFDANEIGRALAAGDAVTIGLVRLVRTGPTLANLTAYCRACDRTVIWPVARLPLHLEEMGQFINAHHHRPAKA